MAPLHRLAMVAAAGVPEVLNTVGDEAAPSQVNALAAVQGLIGPLTA